MPRSKVKMLEDHLCYEKGQELTMSTKQAKAFVKAKAAKIIEEKKK